MAFAHTEPSANSSVLHTYKDSQTEARRKTDNSDLQIAVRVFRTEHAL